MLMICWIHYYQKWLMPFLKNAKLDARRSLTIQLDAQKKKGLNIFTIHQFNIIFFDCFGFNPCYIHPVWSEVSQISRFVHCWIFWMCFYFSFMFFSVFLIFIPFICRCSWIFVISFTCGIITCSSCLILGVFVILLALLLVLMMPFAMILELVLI